jgi:hypothetical protein
VHVPLPNQENIQVCYCLFFRFWLFFSFFVFFFSLSFSLDFLLFTRTIFFLFEKVLRYDSGQLYGAHTDYFDIRHYQQDRYLIEVGGERKNLISFFTLSLFLSSYLQISLSIRKYSTTGQAIVYLLSFSI